VMLHAEHDEALGLIERTERIFSAAELSGQDEEQSLTRSRDLRQRFLEGYILLRTRSPRRIEAVETRVNRFESELKQAGLDPLDLSLPKTAAQTMTRLILQLLTCVLLAPFALIGSVLHYPAYRLAGYLARTFSRGEADVVSTFKIIAALLLFPLTWGVLAFLAWKNAGWIAGISLLVILPLCGYVAIRFVEEMDRFSGSFQALMLFILQRRSFVRLLAERAAIRREILALRDETAPTNV
jgi:hypothetical protein